MLSIKSARYLVTKIHIQQNIVLKKYIHTYSTTEYSVVVHTAEYSVVVTAEYSVVVIAEYSVVVY